MSKRDPHCLPGLIEAVVLALGQADISTILAHVGRKISVSKAMAAQRRSYRDKARRRGHPVRPVVPAQVRVGRRKMVCEVLCHLVQQGRLRRIGRGLYAPPLPKIYVEEGKKTG
jgi:hypothetical protein